MLVSNLSFGLPDGLFERPCFGVGRRQSISIGRAFGELYRNFCRPDCFLRIAQFGLGNNCQQTVAIVVNTANVAVKFDHCLESCAQMPVISHISLEELPNKYYYINN